MNRADQEQPKDRIQYALNMTMVAVAGQVGCLTVVVIIVSLILGLFLDRQFDTRPVFTIVFLIGSIPVTLVTMFWVVRKATSHVKPVSKDTQSPLEDADREK
jgi:F0F1-type ATP synthase assembly protein I